MAEAYALIRAIEEKYGPIHEYWFQKVLSLLFGYVHLMYNQY